MIDLTLQVFVMTKHYNSSTLRAESETSPAACLLAETFIKAGNLEWITNHKELHQKCFYVMLIKGF